MLTDLEFATVTFPTVRDDRHRRATQAATASGYAAGYAEGLRAAAEAARLEQRARDERDAADRAARHRALASVLGSLERATEELQRQHIETADAAADRLVELAVDLAEAVVGRRLTEGRDLAAAAVDRALAAADRAEVVAVRVHPDDLRTLTEARAEGEADASLAALAAEVRLVADESLERGDAVVELARGWIDARISTAFARARSIIAEVR